MVASKAARERKAAIEAGDLALVRIDLDAQGGFAYKIACRTCTTKTAKGARAWSAYRPGADNGYLAAMDRWIFHLHEQHAGESDDSGSPAPCLAYLPEAQQRLHERRLEHDG